jgi:hypothetical protein
MFVREIYVIRSVNYFYVKQNEVKLVVLCMVSPELIIWLICNFIIFANLFSFTIQEAALNSQEQKIVRFTKIF